MTVQHTANLKLNKPDSGHKPWDVELQALADLVDEAVGGVFTKALTGNASMTIDDGASSEIRHKVIKFTGALGGDATITVPAIEKTWIMQNLTTGGFKLIITAGGVTADLLAGNTATIFCDGTDVFNASSLADLLSNKTLLTPTVADLSNMVHDHADDAGGGNVLLVPTVADLSNMLHDHADDAGGGNTLLIPTIADFSNAEHDHADAAGGGNVLLVPTIADFSNAEHDHTSAAEGGLVPNAMELIETLTASATATLDFETGLDDSKYSSYKFIIKGIVPALDGRIFWIRFSTNGGISYLEDAQYTWGFSGTPTGSGGGTTHIPFGSTLDFASTSHMDGEVVIFNPAGGNRVRINLQVTYINDVLGLSKIFGGGFHSTTSAINAIRFLYNTGNIASGSISLYGMRA